jgi:hypothetical protein
MDINDELRSELRDYAWKYFALHADQRIKTFNFFLILCTLIAGGLITILRDGGNIALGALPAFILTLLSFVFWRLDIRNKQLIHHSEEALMILEDDDRLPDCDNTPNRLKLFRHEGHMTDKRRQTRLLRLFSTHYSYSTCFNLVFLIFGLSGLITGIILLIL